MGCQYKPTNQQTNCATMLYSPYYSCGTCFGFWRKDIKLYFLGVGKGGITKNCAFLCDMGYCMPWTVISIFRIITLYYKHLVVYHKSIGPKCHKMSVTVTKLCLLGAVMKGSSNYLLIS